MTSINFCVMDLLTLCNAHSSNTIFIYSFACLYNLYIVYYLLLKVIIQCNRLKKSSHSKIKLKRFTRSHKNNIYKNEKQTNGAWEMKNTETHKKNIYIYHKVWWSRRERRIHVQQFNEQSLPNINVSIKMQTQKAEMLEKVQAGTQGSRRKLRVRDRLGSGLAAGNGIRGQV